MQGTIDLVVSARRLDTSFATKRLAHAPSQPRALHRGTLGKTQPEATARTEVTAAGERAAVRATSTIPLQFSTTMSMLDGALCATRSSAAMA